MRLFLCARDAAALHTVEADGVHLVQEGERLVLVGQVADLLDGRDVAVHGVYLMGGNKKNKIQKVSIKELLYFIENNIIVL